MATRWLRERLGLRPPVESRALSAQNVPPTWLPSLPGDGVTPATAPAVADAYACIRVLADAASSIPLHVYRQTDAGRVRVDTGATPELLRNPAPGMTQAALVGQIVAHLNLYGNAYVGKFRDGTGRIAQLALLHPDYVVPEIKAGRPLFTVTDGLRTTTHGADDIIHIKALTVDGLLGLSPVRQARTVLGLSDTLAKHAASFFDSDAIPAGVLRVNTFGQPTVAPSPEDQESGEQPPTDLDEIRAAWSSGQTGKGRRRIAVVSGEVDFTPVGLNMEDAQFLEQRKLSAVEVARIFRVPPHLIGADPGESMTYSNVESQALEFATFSLRPWLVLIEQALSADPALFATRTYCEFVLEALLRADHATRADFYTKALDPLTGWMSRAEVRERENLPPEQPAAAPVPVDVEPATEMA